MKDKERGKRVSECCQHQGRWRASRQRWCTVGRVHRYRSCTLCVTSQTPPPTVGLSAFYRGMEDISCPHSTINARIIISTVCFMNPMTKTVFWPAGLDEILSTRSDVNCTIYPFFVVYFAFKTSLQAWWTTVNNKIWFKTLIRLVSKCFSYFEKRLPFISFRSFQV